MARIYEVGKTWYIDFRYRGRRTRRSLGVTTKQAAEAARLKIELAIIQGIEPLKEAGARLADIFEPYLDYCNKRNTNNTVKYKATHLTRFMQFFGNVPLKTTTRADVESYVSSHLSGAGDANDKPRTNDAEALF
jgi:hypothetical protein